jgi:Holliday junction resolvase RusA-like endonuclease
VNQDAITCVVPGAPVPQPRARMARNGHVYTPDKNIRPFKQAIVLMVRLAARKAGWTVSLGPHRIDIEFVFERPAGHTTKRGRPSSKWRAFPPAHTSGDGDNLMKGVWDAITASGAVWRDDEQIVDWPGRKRYARPGEQPHTRITITRLAEETIGS